MNREKRGAIQVILAAICWSFDGVLCKYIPWSPLTCIGLRAVVCALAFRFTRKSFAVRLTRGTVLGALGMSLTSILFMCATKLTTSANAIVLQYAMPVFVILLCYLVLHQKPSRSDVVTAAFVLLGVLLCSWKGFFAGGGKLAGDLMAIASAVTYSLVFFSSKLPDADTMDYVYLGALMNVPFSAYAFFDPAMTLEPKHILAVIALGLCVAGGYFFIALSLKNVHPVTSALLANLEPVLNPVWTFVFLGEDPGIMTVIGATVVIVAVSLYSIRKSRTPEEKPAG